MKVTAEEDDFVSENEDEDEMDQEADLNQSVGFTEHGL